MNTLEFNINDLKNKSSFTMSIVGKTESGKSTLLYYILYTLKKEFEYIYFVTTNDVFLNDSVLSNFIWLSNIKVIKNNKNSNIAILNLLSEIYSWINDKNKKKTIKSLIIFDDIAKLLYNNVYSTLTKNRHINLSIIMLLHDMLNISVEERKQLTYKIFTSDIDTRRDLDIKNIVVSNTKKLEIDRITSNNSDLKKYLIYYDDLIKYIIIPNNFVIDLKNNSINTLAYHSSQYKDNIIEKINNSRFFNEK